MTLEILSKLMEFLNQETPSGKHLMHNSLRFPKHTAEDMSYVLTWWSRQACLIMAGIHTADLTNLFIYNSDYNWNLSDITIISQ